MGHRVCFAYQWATYGGVERVLLNRAQAFMAEKIDVEMEIHYAADGGGLVAFERTISHLGLADRMRVVPVLRPERYSAVFVIDSPQMLPERLSTKTQWIVECHTPYAPNREYLGNLPDGIVDILVPSQTFADALRQERPEIASRLRLLRNCVSGAHDGDPPVLPAWKQQALLYFGRLDELKNPQGFLDLMAELERRRPGHFIAVVMGPELHGYGMDTRVAAAGLRGKVVRLPPLSFVRTGQFLAAWRELRGVMISPSRGESFGLAAAESIAAGVPTLLSMLPEHAELLGGDERHLYWPDDPGEGADKLEAMIIDYDAISQRMLERARYFSNAAFVSDWQELMRSIGLCPDSYALSEEAGK